MTQYSHRPLESAVAFIPLSTIWARKG